MSWHTDRPDTILRRSVQMLTLHVEVLKRLRQIAEEQAPDFRSEGFTRFFAMLAGGARGRLPADGRAASARARVQARRARERRARQRATRPAATRSASRPRARWTERLPFANRSSSYSFTIPDRDEGGFKALEELRAKGHQPRRQRARAVGRSCQELLRMLRLELAFYVGCLNLHERLAREGRADVLPDAAARGRARTRRRGPLRRRACRCTSTIASSGNEVQRRRQVARDDHRRQPGRQVDLPAQRRPRPADDAVRHVRRRASRSAPASAPASSRTTSARKTPRMRSGKLDEELGRMSEIADQITPQLDPALQRVVRRHQRARRLRDRAARSSARCSTSGSRSSSSRTCTTSPTASTPNSCDAALFLRAERRAGRTAHLQARRARAAAHQLRRGLLPAHLRRAGDP